MHSVAEQRLSCVSQFFTFCQSVCGQFACRCALPSSHLKPKPNCGPSRQGMAASKSLAPGPGSPSVAVGSGSCMAHGPRGIGPSRTTISRASAVCLQSRSGGRTALCTTVRRSQASLAPATSASVTTSPTGTCGLPIALVGTVGWRRPPPPIRSAGRLRSGRSVQGPGFPHGVRASSGGCCME